MLNTAVFSFGVFSDQNGVDVVIGCFVALDASAGTHVCEQVEGTTEREVEGDVTFADGGRKGTLQGDQVSLDRLDRLVWKDSSAVPQSRGDINGFPLDGDFCSMIDILDRLRNLRTNTISFY